MRPAKRAPPEATYEVEAGGWLRYRQRRPELDDLPAAKLLALGEQLGGNLRYATGESGAVIVGGIRWPNVEFSLDHTHARLCRLAQCPPQSPPPEADLVETALDASGQPWSRRDSGWVIPASPDSPHELRVSLEDQGVRVEATLATWSEIGGAPREAAAEFLCRSHFGIRFARAAMDDVAARAVSYVEEADYLEQELIDSLGSVATTARWLARETQALLYRELAEIYLNVSRNESLAVGEPARVSALVEC